MHYLLFALLCLAFFFCFKYILAFLLVRNLKWKNGRHELKQAKDVPAYLQELFQIPIRQLETFGFKPYGYLQSESMLVSISAPNWGALLCNKVEKTYAIVGINRPLEPVRLFSIQFHTFFRDRTLLLTANGTAQSLLNEQYPYTDLQDACTAQDSVQWELHRDRVRQLSYEKTPCVLSPQKFVEASQSHEDRYFKTLQEKGILIPIPGTSAFRLSFRRAITYVRQFPKDTRKLAALLQKRRELAESDPSIIVEIPVELEVDDYLCTEATRQGLTDGLFGRKFRTLLLFISLGIFITFSTRIFSPYSLLIFLAVLGLHEGGHILAMLLFGYRDPAVLFIPFLGALATARQKEDATLAQKVWISLAGPLPGLILGLGLAVFSGSLLSRPDWLNEVIWMLIGLNLFNLLPIYPLDGGQVADLLLFSRVPLLGVLFKSVGVLLLALLGLAGQPLLLVFALLIALSIPESFRSEKRMAKLCREIQIPPNEKRETLLVSIFQQLKNLGYGNLPVAKKSAIAKELILNQHLFRRQRGMRLGLITLYFGSLLGGIVGTIGVAIPNFYRIAPELFATPQQRRERLERAMHEEIEEATAALQTNSKNIDAYEKRAQAKMLLKDETGALADYNRLVSLSPQDVKVWLARAELYETTKQTQKAFEDYSQALRLEPKDASIYHSRAAVRTRLGDRRGAMSDYNAAIALDARDSNSYVMRAYGRQELEDYQGAIADCNLAIKFDPENSEAYELRSKLHRQLGSEAQAMADERKANELYD